MLDMFTFAATSVMQLSFTGSSHSKIKNPEDERWRSTQSGSLSCENQEVVNVQSAYIDARGRLLYVSVSYFSLSFLNV